MDPNPKPNSNEDPSLNLKVIHWEDFQQELARLVSLSSALHQAHHKKLSLQRRLQSLIEVTDYGLCFLSCAIQFCSLLVFVWVLMDVAIQQFPIFRTTACFSHRKFQRNHVFWLNLWKDKEGRGQ